MKRFSLLILQIAVISLCAYGLYQDYQRVGHFQWVDPDAMEDDEELYLNVYAFVFICLGLFTLLSQLCYRAFYKGLLRQITWILNLLNAVLCLFIGGIFLLYVDANRNNDGPFKMEWYILATGLGLIALAMVIFLESNKKLRENGLHRAVNH